MSKDPAFLWFPGDWLGGTLLFNRYHKGAYMDVLMAQFNNGHMTLQEIKIVLGEKDEYLWEEVLKKKFTEDYEGKFFNEKLEREMIRRKAYTDSRKRNLKKEAPDMVPHMGDHMENGNGNEYSNSIILKEESEGKILIDYQFIIDNYHSLCPNMRKVVQINDFRKGLINARFGENGMDKIISVIRTAGESDFLNGKNDKAWKADFEWIMRPQNFLKILEGKYENKKIRLAV
jgi:hypothetical protein